MKVFVVTACHNRKELTSQLANTLLMQTYKDVVFLLVDDGSTDGTISILEEFSKQYPEQVLKIYLTIQLFCKVTATYGGVVQCTRPINGC